MKNVTFQFVSMKNFRCHENMDFNFEPNRFVALIGKNGVGKTSIFDAVCWALYDVTTKGMSGEDHVVRKRSGKNTEVILKFKIDNDQYEIRNYQKHNKHANSKFLFKNNKDISEVRRDLTTKKISNLLMPINVFLNCLLFSQFMKRPFSELEHSKQKEIFDKMLGLELYEEKRQLFSEAVKNNEEDNKKFIQEMPFLEEIVEGNRNRLEEEKKNFLEKISLSKKQISEFEKEIQKYIEFINLHKEKIEDINKIEKRRNELISNRSSILETKKTNRENFETKVGQLRENIQLQFEKEEVVIESGYKDLIRETDKKISENDNQKDALNNEKDKEAKELEMKIQNKKMEIETEFQKDSGTLTLEIQNLQSEISGCDDNLLRLCTEADSLEKELKNIENKMSQKIPECYACGQSIITKESLEKIKSGEEKKESKLDLLISTRDNFYKKKRDLSENFNLTKRKLIESTSFKNNRLEKVKKRKVERELEIGEKYKDLLESTKKKSETLNNELTSIEEKIEEDKKKRKDELNEEFKKKRENILQEVSSNDKKLSTQLKEVDKKINDKELELSNLKEIKTEYEKAVITNEHREKDIKRLEQEEKEINSSFEIFRFKLEKEIESTLERYNQCKEGMESFNNKDKILRFWRDAFGDKGIKSILLDESIPLLNNKSRELCSLTNGIKVSFDSQTMLKTGEMRDKFSVNVIQTKNLTDDPKDFSGGESRIVNIIILMCLRNLLETMHNISFNILLLDEILDALDPDNVNVVLYMIRQMSDKQTPVLITHTLRDFLETDEVLQL